MPYKDPIKEKQRSLTRRGYFRNYQRNRKAMGLVKYVYVSRTKDTLYQRTLLGRAGEAIALETLEGSIRVMKPSDLQWENKLVEVKASRKILVDTKSPDGKRVKGKTYRWKFCLTQLRTVDLFFIICKDLEDKVQYIFLIPDKDLRVKNLSITERQVSKYSNYLLAL